MIPAEVMVDARQKAQEATDKPTNPYAAAIIILIWIGLALITGWLIFRLL